MVTPLIKLLAFRLNVVDYPGRRKIHTKGIPRMGGLGIFLGFVVAIFFVHKVHGGIIDKDAVVILLGALAVVLIGMIDDIFNVKAPVKLLIEILIASGVVAAGISIQFVVNPFTSQLISLGWLAPVISVVWILTLMNTINLIDGLDGLASGVVVISAFSLFVISLILGQNSSSLLLIALAGATVGFLKYNFNPASIFMGDAGSLFLGYVLAIASIQGVLKSSLVISLAIPILSLLIPILDTLMAIKRRVAQKKHIFRPDAEHIHHKLLGRGYSHREAVLVLYYTAILLNVMAIILSFTKGIFSWLVIVIVVVVIIKGFNQFRKHLKL